MYTNEKNNDGKTQNLRDENFIDMNFTRVQKCNSKIKIHLLKITNKKHPR
jgi:hypothetical protein